MAKKMVKVIALVEEEQRRRLYHALLDENKSFAEWLREQINAYLVRTDEKTRPTKRARGRG
ncbi:MAG: hypothetical protein AB1346_10295 [Thermodesulfobacteriota bacterium]